MTEQQTSYTYLHTLLSCNTLLNQLYELRGTPYFRQQLKYHANALAEELGKLIDNDMSQLYGIDDDTYGEIIVQHQQIIQLFASLNPNHLPVVKSILEMYLQKPDEVAEMFNMKLIPK